jgi:rare lipoprotein A (peptidoglycan hydrolase)
MTTARTRKRPADRACLMAAVAACALALLGVAFPAQAATTGGVSTITATEAQGSIAGTTFSDWRSAGATWYGPGLYGRHTACGETLRPGTIGVAHRNLPCGTAVKFVFHGRQIVTQVIDRGPYSHGNDWDLTSRAAEALGFSSTGQAQIRYAIAAGNPRP